MTLNLQYTTCRITTFPLFSLHFTHTLDLSYFCFSVHGNPSQHPTRGSEWRKKSDPLVINKDSPCALWISAAVLQDIFFTAIRRCGAKMCETKGCIGGRSRDKVAIGRRSQNQPGPELSPASPVHLYKAPKNRRQPKECGVYKFCNDSVRMCRCNDDGIPKLLMKGCCSGVAVLNSDCSITLLESKDTRTQVSN